MSDKLKVVEIFRSISGESIMSGQISVFVRLFGCNLRCSYCDTPYGYEGTDYTEMTIEEIVNKVEELSPNGNVVLTGGEPLIHPNVEYLIKALLEVHHQVEIETNGSIDIQKVCRRLDEIDTDFDYTQLLFTVDYKCPSSGVMNSMLQEDDFVRMIKCTSHCYEYGYTCAVKFVVETEEDLEVASRVSRKLMSYDSDYCELLFGRYIYISPVYGADIPKIIDYMANDEVLCWCRLQLQLHKYIWDPDKRGV